MNDFPGSFRLPTNPDTAKRPHLLPQVRAMAKIGVSMANEIVPQVFNNPEFGQLRTIKDAEGDPWFVATDVARALDLRDAEKITRRLDRDEFRTLSKGTSGMQRDYAIISEAGLYGAVLSSKKPEAKAFKRWVTHEVLPAIRRDGGYMVAKADETPEETMARAVLIAQKTIERQNKQIEEMRPKAVFADAVSVSKSTILVGDLAKILHQNGFRVGQNRLFALLRDQGFLCKKKGDMWNMPTQRAREMGLFKVKETAITHSDGHVTVSKTVKVTGKGQIYFINRFCREASDGRAED